MAKNKKYWQDRMESLEDESYHQSMVYYKDVQEQFRVAANNIQMDIERWYRRLADNNDISYAAAKRFLNDSELEEFKWTLEQYIEAGRESGINGRWIKELENASAKYHVQRMEAMKLQMGQHAERLFTEFEGSMGEFLRKTYGEQFYRTAYEISKGTEIGINLSLLDESKTEVIIKHPWAQDGKNFSDRIWQSKDRLINSLHTELIQNIIRGETPDKVINNLAKKMNVSKSQAGNLVMTESAAISSAARKNCFKELEIEQYQFDATLDGKTCDVCGSLDQKVFSMTDYEVGLTANPIHPRCRCCTVPYYDDWEEFGISPERVARDPETGKIYEVPADMTYKEWHAQYIEKNPVKALAERKQRNEKRDKDQYKNYKEILGGKHLPDTFSHFQEVKYGSSDEYGILKAQVKGMGYYSKAVVNEPEITKHVRAVAKGTGMDGLGIEYRIKAKESFLEKIRRNYNPDGNEYEIKDIIRYTLGADTDTLTDKTLKTIDKFEQEGYNTIRVKNTWGPDSSYDGINTSIKAPSGQIFEMQYHTPESFELKNGELHKLYEEQRKILDYRSKEYIELEDRMIDLSNQLTFPKNIERVKNK
jgi:SPP1 gp7 family putative phage head morphogenesis protein